MTELKYLTRAAITVTRDPDCLKESSLSWQKYRLKSYETAALVWIIPRRGNCSLLLLRLLRLLLRLLGLAAWRMAAARFGINELAHQIATPGYAFPSTPAKQGGKRTDSAGPCQMRRSSPRDGKVGKSALCLAGPPAARQAVAAEARLGDRPEAVARRSPGGARILTGLRESSALTLRDTGGPLSKNSTQARKSQRRLRLSHSDGVRCCSL